MRETTADDLRALWADLGVATGDTLMIHSNLSTLGRCRPDAGIVVATLLDAVGRSGTIVAPTFTYSVFRDEVFDVEETPSRVGVLGDLVRRWPSAVRSVDPGFSVAAVGRAAEDLVGTDYLPLLGPGGVYTRLEALDVRFLLLGVDFTSLAYFMHLESVLGVPYRYPKRFTASVRASGRVRALEMTHVVRDDRREPQTDRRRIGERIESHPACRILSYGLGQHRLVAATDVARIVADALEQDPHVLLHPEQPFREVS